MALKGYLNENTYCAITQLIYEKEVKRCSIGVDIYADSSKQEIVANFGLVIEGSQEAPEIVSLTPQSVVPENIENTFFLVAGQVADNALLGHEGRIARISKITNDVESYILTENSFLLYVVDESKFKLFKQGEWVEIHDMLNDKRVWDKWLAPEVAFAEGTNPTKQAYALMKTMKRFAGCEDA